MSHQSTLLISDLPAIHKPRERLQILGSKNLTNQELVAILLRTGTSKSSALVLAQKLVKNNNLKELTSLSFERLCKTPGIGPAKASTLLACFELARRCQQQSQLVSLNTPKKVFAQAFSIKDKSQEVCLAMYLDGRQRLLQKKTLAIGSLNQNFLEFRELLKPAFCLPAAGIILVHNHPSGNVQPSQEDLTVTKHLMKGLDLVGVELIDHLIVTKEKYFSMKEAGVMR